MERELCLHVPAQAQFAIAKAVRSHKAGRQSLRALYFDTATRTLAGAGIALRVRCENGQWVQTVKAPGPDPLSRIEINHPRPSAELDLSLYDSSPLAEFLASLSEPLGVRYETDVQRESFQLEHAGANIEVASDTGFILAKGWKLPVNEIEFELLEGEMAGVFDLALHWLNHYGLIIETRSKAQRGDRLAALMPASKESTGSAPPALFEPRRAMRLPHLRALPAVQGYITCSTECLLQVSANASLLAGVDATSTTAEQTKAQFHQFLRGVRRLQACWKRYSDLAPGTRPDLSKMFHTKQAHQWRDTAASREFQSMLLRLLKHTVLTGDRDRQQVAVSSPQPL